MNVLWHGIHQPSVEPGRAHVFVLSGILPVFVPAGVRALNHPPGCIRAATMKAFTTMGIGQLKARTEVNGKC